MIQNQTLRWLTLRVTRGDGIDFLRRTESAADADGHPRQTSTVGEGVKNAIAVAVERLDTFTSSMLIKVLAAWVFRQALRPSGQR